MRRKRILWIVFLVVVLAAGGAGYFYYSAVRTQAQAPAAEGAIATYTVTRGDLVVSASGSGTLVPTAEVALGFGSSGVLAEVLVSAGEQVEAGRVLARLDATAAQDAVTQAEISLRQAELDLVALTETADAGEIAAAQASLSSAKANLTALTSPAADQELLAAQESLKSAQETLADLLDGPDQDTVTGAQADLTLAEMSLRVAQTAYDKVAYQANVGATQEAMDLWEATTNYEKAQATYNEAVAGATDDEISDARAQVAQAEAELDALLEAPDADEVAAAQAQVAQAEAELETLLAGTATRDVEAAELSVAQAQLELDSAQRALAETELLAPSAGTVLAVEAQAGEAVGTEAIITLGNMDEPQVQFWVEESDLASVAPGNAVSVVFEALPDLTFSGKIVSVDPALVDVDGTAAVQSYASLDLEAQPVALLSGMNADVEVVAGEALNAVLVPLEALRELGPDQFAVFVVLADGEQEMRVVTVGLKDYVNVEILSGLEPGEVVSLGTAAETNTAAPETDEGQPGPQMMPFMGG